MTQTISNNDMATVRRSLAEAGIYFDKLYINQAYFNSNFTIQTSREKPKKSNKGFWHKLLCGSDTKQSSTGTQTVLTVRDDAELKAPPVIRRHRMTPGENVYDRRRYRPVNREYTHNIYQQSSVRRRRSSVAARSVPLQRQKPRNNDDDGDDEFAV